MNKSVYWLVIRSAIRTGRRWDPQSEKMSVQCSVNKKERELEPKSVPWSDSVGIFHCSCTDGGRQC